MSNMCFLWGIFSPNLTVKPPLDLGGFFGWGKSG
jgi:hypothetical protein